MTEAERIVDQLKRALDGPAWHGPSINEILSDVDAALAAALPMDGVHTIWEILLHVTVWIRIGRMRIDGEQTPKTIDPKQDWPLIDNSSNEAWKQAILELREEHKLLVNNVSRLPDSDLAKIIPGTEYTYYFLLHGIVQHNLYHAGQMSLIKSSLLKRKG
jgi:uncharacterized damage-inducible protein DinB